MKASKLLSEIKRKIRVHFPLRLIALCIAAILLTLLLITRTTISNVSAVEAAGVGVYWDSDCSDPVSLIDWGTLAPGSAKDITVYIRNEEAENVALSMETEKWSPSNASIYMTLSWNYMGQPVKPGEVIPLKLTLSISIKISGITNFSFDIILEAYTYEERKHGDVNNDGYVNSGDLILLGKAWGTSPGDPRWDKRADLNGDRYIGGGDLVVLGLNWGKY